MRSVHVTVMGRVQGVGYRAWCAREARNRDMKGWVRNRHNGAVEALFIGESDAVSALLAACHTGPKMARVESVEVKELPEAELNAALSSGGCDVFAVLETV